MIAPLADSSANGKISLLQQRIQETESRFRTMADCAPVLLWMAGVDASCNFFNQTWLDFSGRTMEQEEGIGWAEGIHPEDFQRSVDTYLEAFNARRPFRMEYRLMRHDGQYRWILDHGVPRYAPDGAFAGYIGSCIDITERFEAEVERKALVAELQRALAIRDEFISIASHELMTPLATLQLQSERLLRLSTGDIDEARLRKIAAVTVTQVERLGKLVRDMVDISRIAACPLFLERTEVDLGDLVAETVEQLAGPLASAGCDVTLELEPGVVGAWDSFRLSQVILNLLSNAMKYAAGTPVHVSVRANGPRAILEVRDRGPGIAARDHARIFERFERATPPEAASGLGLGLYLVRAIVGAHGGSARVESEPGHGAAFIIELPLRPAAEAPPSR